MWHVVYFNIIILIVQAPHIWLCDGEILCLLDAEHSNNISAFQVCEHSLFYNSLPGILLSFQEQL